MKVFVTGATGFIGSAVVEELREAGHAVIGLARSENSAKRLQKLGAEVHFGSIEDVESLRSGAAKADGVIHTAFFHEITHLSFSARLRVITGGSPVNIMSRFLASAVETDRRAIETLGQALTSGDQPLVAAFGTMGMAPGRLATEDADFDPQSAGGLRGANEKLLEALAERGVRATGIRLAPVVHGTGDKGGLAPRLLQMAKKNGVSIYVGDGKNRWPAVHRLDAAQLFRLALEKGVAGTKYHGVAEEGIPFIELAEFIGKRVSVPVASRAQKEANKSLSWVGMFTGVDNPSSSKSTRERLAWEPKQLKLFADLAQQKFDLK